MNAFWLLCVVLSLAVFFITIATGSLVANAAAWLIWRFTDKAQLLYWPGLLFSIRVFPVALGLATTLGLALPSFLLLEPKRSVEAPEPYLIVLASLALAILVFLSMRCAKFLFRSRKTVKKWMQTSERLPISASVPVYQLQTPDSIIAVAGILRPKVFAGKAALATLTAEELLAAIAHELGHMHSLDNLKQFVLKFTRLPSFFVSLGKIDAAWSAAAELVADANALRYGTSPLELSSAIVKVGRLKAVPIDAFSVAACHLIPPADGSPTLAVRIQHLQEALEVPSRSRMQAKYGSSATLLVAVAVYVAALPSLLPVVHRWMEWLVR